MPQVDFYILPSSEPSVRVDYSCKLSAKAWHEGMQVYIYCDSEALCQEIDQRMWSFRAESFVPHDCLESSSHSPVLISNQAPPEHHAGLLINLAAEIPEQHARFARIAELVIDEPVSRQILREHFRFYRERGYPLRDHRLNRY